MSNVDGSPLGNPFKVKPTVHTTAMNPYSLNIETGFGLEHKMKLLGHKVKLLGHNLPGVRA